MNELVITPNFEKKSAKYADAIAEASYRSLGSAAQGGPESAVPCGGLFM